MTIAAGNGVTAATTSLGYDPAGNLVSIDGPLPGNADTTTFQYDAIRRPVATITPDPDGGGPLPNRMRKITYDARGRVSLEEIGTSNATGGAFSAVQQQSTAYDAADQATKRTLAAGAKIYGIS